MIRKRLRPGIRSIRKATVTALLMAVSSTAAAELNIAKNPLFLGKAAEPNIMFILDDSGSMLWSYLPDSIKHHSGHRLQSHLYNAQYYNPDITYTPPPRGDGTYYPDSDFEWAPTDGFNTSISDAWGCTNTANNWYACGSNNNNRTHVNPSEEFQATWNHKQYSTRDHRLYFVGSKG